MLADFVDGANVRMIQCGGRLSFALETRQGLRIFGNFVREKLESDEPTEARVFRFVDNAHSAAAEFLDNAVVRDCLADHHTMLDFRVASSYGRGIRESTNGGSDTVALNPEYLCWY
jgi:hypothetical protein